MAGATMREAFDSVTLWKPADVAASTGVAVGEIIAMFDFSRQSMGANLSSARPRHEPGAHASLRKARRRHLFSPGSLGAIGRAAPIESPQS